MTPRIRALGATALFSVSALAALFLYDGPREYLMPHLIFFAVLTINTYYSIRFYARFTPPSAFQSRIDLVLAAAYVSLALSIWQPIAFLFFALVIFALAPAKYAHMLGQTPYDQTLRKKILIDLLGTFMCVAVLGIAIMGYEIEAAWILASLFTLANAYLLFVNPMYRFVERLDR